MDYLVHVFVFTYGVLFCSASIEYRLRNLESLVKLQQREHESLSSRIASIENDVFNLYAACRDPKKSDDNKIATGVQKALPTFPETVYKRASGNTIAFYAYLSSNDCYHNHEVIIFDAESLDVGGVSDVGVYDKRDGIFEPHVAGVYVFTWTVAAPTGSRVVTELIISGRVEGVLTTDPDVGVSINEMSTMTDPPPQRRAVSGIGSGVHPSTAVVTARVSAVDRCFIRVSQNFGSCATVLSDRNTVFTTFSAWQVV